MKKRIYTCILAIVMVFSTFVSTPVMASARTTGKIGSSDYCTVQINRSLINKRGKQYATVKFKTYDMTGWYNTGAKVQVTLRDGNGNYICSWVAKGGDTFKLGDDHSTYRIYVNKYNEPCGRYDWVTGANNFSNNGSSVSWNVSGAKNCSIY